MDQEPKQKVRNMSPDHVAKLIAGRNAYLARKRALKEATLANPPVVSPEVVKQDEYIFAPAKPGTIYPDRVSADDIVEKKKPGRPSKYTKEERLAKAREDILLQIDSKKDKLLQAQIDAATGFYYTTADGKHVYTQKPDTGASEYLLNQLIGKAKESVEVTSINLNVDL